LIQSYRPYQRYTGPHIDAVFPACASSQDRPISFKSCLMADRQTYRDRQTDASFIRRGRQNATIHFSRSSRPRFVVSTFQYMTFSQQSIPSSIRQDVPEPSRLTVPSSHARFIRLYDHCTIHYHRLCTNFVTQQVRRASAHAPGGLSPVHTNRNTYFLPGLRLEN